MIQFTFSKAEEVPRCWDNMLLLKLGAVQVPCGSVLFLNMSYGCKALQQLGLPTVTPKCEQVCKGMCHVFELTLFVPKDQAHIDPPVIAPASIDLEELQELIW